MMYPSHDERLMMIHLESTTQVQPFNPASALLLHRSHSQVDFPHLAGCHIFLLPSRPAMPLPPSAATARRLQANLVRGTESTLHHHETSVGPLQRASVLPHRRHAVIVPRHQVGRPAAKSVCPPTPNSMKWNTRPMMPSSIGCEPSSPQAFLIFLNRETPSQHTVKVEVN